LVIHVISPVALFSRMNRRDLIFRDPRTEDSGSVILNCSTDAVRDAISITLRQLIDSELESGREFFHSPRVI
jgi:hypothetical protein